MISIFIGKADFQISWRAVDIRLIFFDNVKIIHLCLILIIFNWNKLGLIFGRQTSLFKLLVIFDIHTGLEKLKIRNLILLKWRIFLKLIFVWTLALIKTFVRIWTLCKIFTILRKFLGIVLFLIFLIRIQLVFEHLFFIISILF